MDDGAAAGDRLDEGWIGSGVAPIQHAEFGEDRGGRADRRDELPGVGAPQHLFLDRRCRLEAQGSRHPAG